MSLLTLHFKDSKYPVSFNILTNPFLFLPINNKSKSSVINAICRMHYKTPHTGASLMPIQTLLSLSPAHFHFMVKLQL